ncbi:MAG: hypothetical protein H0V17_32960 [Deltaproteobacteria bacterium]|nr:hypothetical protein [Deltaproteobacteria bacterium]
MRPILLAILLSSTSAFAAPEPVEAPAKKQAPKDEEKFPIPKDATGGDAAPGGGGKILMYKVPRGKAAVATEVKESLTKAGWKITNDGTASPSGRSIRVEVTSKSGKLYKASFTGVDDKESAIILTLP